MKAILSSKEYLTAKISEVYFIEDALVIKNGAREKILHFQDISEIGMMRYGFITPIKNVRIKHAQSVIYVLVEKQEEFLKHLADKCNKVKISNRKVAPWLSYFALFMYMGAFFSVTYSSLLEFGDRLWIFHPFMLSTIMIFFILPSLLASYRISLLSKRMSIIIIKAFFSIWLMPLIGAIAVLVYCERYYPSAEET